MNLAEDPRAAGQVRRYHTWAVIKDQSVAEHTWQIMRILLTIWPTVPRNVLVYALIHDMGEMSGDVQYPFKILFPELAAGSEKAEAHVRSEQRRHFGAPDVRHPISKFEHYVVKTCDNLEMWEYGLRERNMGNRYASIIVARMSKAVSDNLSNIQSLEGSQQYDQNPDVVKNTIAYITTRQQKENFDGQE